MSIHNRIAWSVGILGLISLAFGIMMISSFSHTGDPGDARLGGWLLALGLLGVLNSVFISDLSTSIVQDDEDLEDNNQDVQS